MKPKDEKLSLMDYSDKSENLYEACIALSRRSRQINQKYTDELKLQLGELENDEETPEDTATREAIVTEFDKKPKPVQQAMKELQDGSLKYEYRKSDK